ncbi:MAG TPA: hypothetical protein VMZ53_23065 [Kofleriaceae bacterium]|nr:hypothetical protein [Kofleriaceae bacterium]
MTTFETIDISALDLVQGGADEGQGAPNREQIRIGVQAQGDRTGGRANIGVEGERSRTNYAVCVQETRQAGGTPRDIRETCGLPPS